MKRKAPRPVRPGPPGPVASAPALAPNAVSFPELVADLEPTDRISLATSIRDHWDGHVASSTHQAFFARGMRLAFNGAPPDAFIEDIALRHWRGLSGEYCRRILELGDDMLVVDADGLPRLARELIDLLRTHEVDGDELEGLVAAFREVAQVLDWWRADDPIAPGALVYASVKLVQARASEMKCPAVPHVVLVPLARLLSGVAEIRSEQGLLVVKAGRDRLATLRSLPAGLTAEEATRAFSSVHAHRLLRFLLARAWEQTAVHRAIEPHVIRIDEGWSGLAKMLGVAGRKAAAALKSVGELLADLRLDGPIAGPLIQLKSRRARRANGAATTSLIIELLGPLRPGFVHSLRDTGLDRRLIPLPHVIGPLTAGTKTQAAQSSFQMLFLRELHLRASDFDDERFVVIPRRTLDELGSNVGLEPSGVSSVLTAWQDPANGPFIERVKEDRYKLSARFAQLDAHVAQFAKISAAGRARAARKRRKR